MVAQLFCRLLIALFNVLYLNLKRKRCRKRVLLRLVEAVKAVRVRVPICTPAACCSFINL
ncbi:hypothetical protein HDF23_005485 [Mucilaginibacter lappiensis]|uniref:Uncharacterized protein n=1 Tax=Mucilaginibacter lappiensis TaxID=354630 RepID=A0ABR6PSE3_9SPHI|nr:hypothetical protein [Mucilaginibacter lappiensis]